MFHLIKMQAGNLMANNHLVQIKIITNLFDILLIKLAIDSYKLFFTLFLLEFLWSSLSK